MGTGTDGTTSIALSTFQNSGTLTFTGNADTRNTTPSSSYSGASGGKNVFITQTIGTYFTISGINTSNYNTLKLSFGFHKTSGASGPISSVNFIIEVATDYNSTNNTGTFTALSYPTVSTAGGIWSLVNTTGTIPSSITLAIRFRQNTSTIGIRIDDVKLTGTPTTTSHTVTFNPNGGTGIITTQSGSSPANLTEASTFTNRADYKFGYLNNQADGEGLISYVDQEEYPFDADIGSGIYAVAE